MLNHAQMIVDVADDPVELEKRTGILRAKFYRKRSQDSRNAWGKTNTGIDAGIRDGSIPSPMWLSATGKECGWYGWMIIETIKRRALESVERERALRDPNRVRHPGGRPRQVRGER